MELFPDGVSIQSFSISNCWTKRHPFVFLKILDRNALPGKGTAAIFSENVDCDLSQIVMCAPSIFTRFYSAELYESNCSDITLACEAIKIRSCAPDFTNLTAILVI